MNYASVLKALLWLNKASIYAIISIRNSQRGQIYENKGLECFTPKSSNGPVL